MPGLIKPSPTKIEALRSPWRGDIGDHVISLAWSPDGKYLAGAAVSGEIHVWETASGTVGARLKGHSFGTTALAWRPDSGLLASAGQDGGIRFWDVAAGTERQALAGGSSWVEHLAWGKRKTATGVEYLLASAAGKKLRLWDGGGNLVRDYPDQPSTISDLHWKPGPLSQHEPPTFATSGYSLVKLWNPESTAPLQEFEWKGSHLVLRWSPDGNFIATGDQDSTVHFWIMKTGRDLQMWGYPTKVRELAWDYTSRYLATGGSPVVTIWDCAGKGPAGTRPIELKGHEGFLSALAYQHAAPRLASGGIDGLVALWQPNVHKRMLARAVHSAGITSVTWSPNDKLLAVGTETGEVAVYQ